MVYEFHEVTVERRIGDGILSISAGKLAKQAGGSVMVRYGETVILAAATSAPPREGIDFFPLMVDYREKTYATGKFPGGFIKREGPPRGKEILTSRMADRPIRPLFPHGYRDEVQVLISTLSADRQNDPDILAMIGASAALFISDMPFLGPTGSVRVGRVDGQYRVLPTADQLAESDLDLVVSGNAQSVLMIEGFGNELPEAQMAEAIMFAQRQLQPIIEMQHELRERLGRGERPQFEAPENPLVPVLRQRCYQGLRDIMQIAGKQQRNEAATQMCEQLVAELAPDENAQYTEQQVQEAFGQVKQCVVRDLILEGRRPDGRDPKQLRDLYCEVSVMPRTHGSALFARGETQALVTTTLGTVTDGQKVDGLMEEYTKRFMLDYNMPPFSVGEVRPIRGPGRREVGHGALAERSLKAVMPSQEQFPYTIRVVSDILESNGSSSMASVCGGTLSLMDAGVPISDPVAGVSIGLVKEADDRYVLLTDIIGDEDHYGDMDFKVAGTQRGITGIQLDLKVAGINEQIIRQTLEQAREARMEILRAMMQCLDKPRPDISPYAPRLVTLQIDPDKIGTVIGPGGRMIRQLEADTGATIEIEDDGTVTVSSVDRDAAEKAAEQIRLLTAEVEVGKVYTGRVVSVTDFGAFIEILPGKDGLCHISELAGGYVKNVSDVCKVGDTMEVKVILIDEQERVKLSRRAVLQERGELPARGDGSAGGYERRGGGRGPGRGHPGGRGGSRSGGGGRGGRHHRAGHGRPKR